MLKFYVKGFRVSVFPNPVMYFIFMLGYDDRYWSKSLRGTIPIPYMTLRSRSQNVYVKVLRKSF